MSSFHRFLDLIGIVKNDGSNDKRSKRNAKRDSERAGRDEDGRDFSDDGALDSPPSAPQGERDTYERYSGYAKTRSSARSSVPADDEVSNVVEFKNNPQTYRNNAPGERRSKTIIHYLRTINDCMAIIDDLLNDCQVLLNLEDADDALQQRAIDVVYGAQYALHAKMRQVSRYTYIIAPETVDVDQTDNRRAGNGSNASNMRSFRS